jgi:uncharacterized protein YaiI (UPF0178 family)
VIEIVVDADACPVKDEVYGVAARYELAVVLVANAPLWTPPGLGVEMVVVDQGPDAADDWIADYVRPGDVVVTADLPLAARCLEAGARALGPDGRPFTEDSIGGALATRAIKSQLRDQGLVTSGPRALAAKDRSRFLSTLDRLVQQGMREHPPGGGGAG